jgi:hypothetical protein
MTKEFLHKKAVELRKAGYSYSYIKRKINVSKSTLCAWLSDLPYKRNQETVDVISRARLMANEAKRAIKRKSIKDAGELAVKDIGKFTKRDLFMLGIGLYIGEGSKTTSSVRVTNSDPKIIKTFICWFKKILNLQNINFSIRIHTYPDNNQEDLIIFWMKETGLPRRAFLKTWIDTRTDKKSKNHGKLPYGTVHLTINGITQGKGGSFLMRRVLAWIEIVHQKAGIV